MFECQKCKYKTDKKFNYNRHLRSKKHLKIRTKYSSNDISNTCKYCKSQFPEDELSEHYNICTEKIIYFRTKDYINEIEFLKTQQKLNGRLIKSLNAQNEFMANVLNDLISFNVTSNKKDDNIIYKNISDLSYPFNKEEIRAFNPDKMIISAIKFVRERCIKNLEYEQLPFLCSDHRRQIFMVRLNGKYIRDPKGSVIEKYLKPRIICHILSEIDKTDKIHLKHKYFMQLHELSNNFHKYVLKPLSDEVIKKENLILD